MRIVLLTSTHRRHKYIAGRLNASFDLAGIISEEKTQFSKDYSTLSSENQEFMLKHLREREVSENQYFIDSDNFPAIKNFLFLPKGRINTPDVLTFLLDINPTFIILFGTSIIKSPILDSFANRIINIHLGLSPYYRGSGTNLWPLYFSEPECVGATIHIAAKEVDAGAILSQVRPDLIGTDSVHDVGNKVLVKVGEKLPVVLNDFFIGSKKPVLHTRSEGKLFRRTDLNADILKRIYSNFENGMIPDYILKKDFRDLDRPIVGID
ncbi:hypothetical protein MASR2M41_14440 [Flammeovirgaceae bacterium]